MIEQDAHVQLAALRAGKITPAALMEETLDRIDQVNPKVNAIVALQDRKTLLNAAHDAPSGPLQGLPIAIKDLLETKGIRTTHGSPIFKDNIPKQDSPLVARLRKAGAVIIGKTNTPEFGLGSHTYNPVYGVTRNPYGLNKSAGGSSGGAAVALATRMLALADGSDAMGSLRNPAGWNNVFGYRPSYGLVTNSSDTDMFLSQLATDGPMARSIADLELLLTVQSEFDPRHPHATGPFKSERSSARKKIGWLGDWGGAYALEPGIRDLCEAALGAMEQQGHEVIEIAPPFPADALWQAWTTLRSWGNFVKRTPFLDHPHDLLKPELLWEIEQGRKVTVDEIHKASALRSDWFRCTAQMEVDILALPSAQMFPFDATLDWPKQIGDRHMDTYHRWMEIVVPASLTGLPALSVPAGFGAAGTPIGLQLIAHRGQDADVLSLGRDYEASTDWVQRAPRL